MDIKEYISSGIIESYVMGLASEEEVSVLECIRLKHPEVEQAIQDAQIILEDLATAQTIAPETNLKQSVWDKIQSFEDETLLISSTHNSDKDTPAIHVQSENRTNTPFKTYVIAASVIAALSIMGNIYLYQRNDQQGNTLDEMKANQQEINRKLVESEQRWALLQRPNVKTIALNGVESYPSLKALVIWDSEQATVYLSASTLPKAPSGKQYQLWAIVDGTPVDAGVLPIQNEETLVRMRDIYKAQAFAITLEKEGGSPAPTLTEMYVIGNI